MNNNQEKSGFEDNNDGYLDKMCRHPQHEPPRMMVVPHGKRYRHVCPGCGNITFLYPSQYTLSV